MTATVMVVDDSALMRKMFSGLFEEHGFNVETARDGEEAINKVVDVKPDIITLDINMPRMDGITCLSLLKRLHECPVIMLSSLTTKGALITLEALALGATDYVLKPGGTVSTDINSIKDELVSKLKALLPRNSYRHSQADISQVRQPEDARPQKSVPVTASTGCFECVLVGVSTGGPKKLEEMVRVLPESFPAPIVISQHMPMNFTQALAKRLNNLSRLNIVEVSERMPLQPGTVYIAKGEADLLFSRQSGAPFVRPVPANGRYLWHPSVDLMVESALTHFNPASLLCVQLTGMGCDGVAAMSAAFHQGATVLAESERTATVYGMPRELIEAGCVTEVLDSHHVAERLMQLCR